MLCILAILSCSAFSKAQDPAALKIMEQAIQDDLRISGAPGAVMGVVQDGALVYHQAFGVANTATNMPVMESTVFQVASITKTFTAAALLTTCEKHGIELNTPVGNIIKGLSPNVSKVTIHQLLCHISGIMDYWPNSSSCEDDLLEYFLLAGDRALFAEPGTVFSYSNNGYALAGLVLATLNESSYEMAVHDVLLKPMGLESTTFDIGEVSTNYFASGHFDGEPSSPGLTSARFQPAGGLWSNIPDLARFTSCFMNGGEIDSVKVLSESTIQKMATEYQLFGVQEQYLSYPESYYGYGMISYSYKGMKVIGHAGEAGIQNALMVTIPEFNTAVIVLSNAGYYPFLHSLESAIDAFIPGSTATLSKDFAQPEFEELVGIYYLPDLSNSKERWIEISTDAKKLIITFPNGNSFPLRQAAKDRFRFSESNVKFESEIGFFPDQKGELKYLNYFWRAYVRE